MASGNTVLIVDDVEMNRTILCSLFEEEYDILEAADGAEALAAVERAPDEIAVILLDIIMPVMNGFQVMEQLREKGLLAKIPVVLITADSTSDNEIKGLDNGASDIIMKPFDPHIVVRRVQNIIDLYRHKNHLEHMVAVQARKLEQTNELVIDALSTVIEYRNLESGQHIRRIRAFTRLLLETVSRTHREYRLTPEVIHTISSASAMHDIGKIAIPDSVLLKPGRLTKEEFEVMKTHTTKGCDILKSLSCVEDKVYLHYCYNICRYHHERWDGRGYPDGLAGGQIPLCAQVVAIADVYDALTNTRCYKPAVPHQEAVRMILAGECGTFSPMMMECFGQVLPAFSELSAAYADGIIPVDEDFPRGGGEGCQTLGVPADPVPGRQGLVCQGI